MSKFRPEAVTALFVKVMAVVITIATNAFINSKRGFTMATVEV
jgi:hypothetical protein